MAGRRRRRLRLGKSQRHLDPEGAAAPGLAGEADAPAYQVDQAPVDGQTEAGAAIAARGRRVSLFEGVEQTFLLLGVEDDPGIGDSEV